MRMNDDSSEETEDEEQGNATRELVPCIAFGEESAGLLFEQVELHVADRLAALHE